MQNMHDFMRALWMHRDRLPRADSTLNQAANYCLANTATLAAALAWEVLSWVLETENAAA